MRITTVGALLLLATSSPAQVVGPAIPLTNTRYSTSGEAAVATLASNGRSFIAAWSTPTGIRVSRIDGSSASIGIPIGGPVIEAPAVAARGDGYVVGWTDGIRYLDSEGRPIGSPISIGTPTPRSRVASNGSAVMLAYPRATFQFEVLGAFIAPSGEVLKKDVRLGTNSALTPPLPFGGAGDKNGFGFVSEDGGEIRIKFFDGEGNLRSASTLDGAESTFPPVQRYMAIATDGREYVVIWSTEERALLAAQFRSDGNFISKTTLVAPSDAHLPTQPSLAFDGQSFVCAYYDGGDVDLMHIAPLDLSVIDTVPFRNAASQAPTVAAANGLTIVAWSRDLARLNSLGSGGVVFASSVAADGTVAATFPVSAAAHDQTSVATASNGTDILVTWMEGNSQQVSLMGGLLRADGSWRELGRLGRGGGTPVVASNGHDFLVIGIDGAFRISAGGEIRDRTPISLGRLAATSAAWDGRQYVAAGEISLSVGVLPISASGDVGALRVIRKPMDDDRALRPVIVANGNELLVTFTWLEPPCGFCFFPVPQGTGARALRLSQSLDMIGPEIAVYPADAVLSTPLAWNGSEYLALAVDYYWVDAVRIARDGTVIGRTRLNENTTNKTRIGNPSVITIGSDFVVTWREAGSTGVASGSAYVCTVHEDGTASAPAAFDQGSASTGDPLLAVDQSGRPRVIRPIFVSEAPYFGAERLVIHTLDSTDAPAAPALEIRANGTGALLAWNRVPAALGYRIEYRNARHDWQEIETSLPPESLTLPVLLDSGIVYAFRVKAIGWGGAAYSNVAVLDPTRRRATR